MGLAKFADFTRTTAATAPAVDVSFAVVLFGIIALGVHTSARLTRATGAIAVFLAALIDTAGGATHAAAINVSFARVLRTIAAPWLLTLTHHAVLHCAIDVGFTITANGATRTIVAAAIKVAFVGIFVAIAAMSRVDGPAHSVVGGKDVLRGKASVG